MTTILITGASGLLGRPVMREFQRAEGFDVRGTAFSRATEGLDRLDLRDERAVRAYLAECAPDVIIHSAAERRPDICENDPEATIKLNVNSTATVAASARDLGAFLIYISTDYVFDGSSPPYFPDSQTNPLNNYGVSKRDGELAVRDETDDAVVLRVPILYGPTESFDESPITIIARSLMDNQDKEITLDHWSTRYPTHTEDVAAVLRQIVERRLEDPSLSGTFQWSGDESMTKYDMGVVLAETLGIASDNIVPSSDPPSGAPRPRNCQLDTSALEQMGIGQRTPFREGVRTVLETLLG